MEVIPPNPPRLKKRTVNPWKKSEDDALVKAVERFGKDNWGAVAEEVPNRTRKQCRERYLNNLDGGVSKHPWTLQEDVVIARLQQQFGNRWTYISTYLPGRTANSIKNRFFSHLRKRPLRALCPEHVACVFIASPKTSYEVL